VRAYVITSLIITGLAILIRMGNLAWSDYPRTVNNSRGEDAFLVLVHFGFLIWAGWLLWS
jgi:hypothetical protein